MPDKTNSTESISFSVDAGIINRLGKELVGRAETAVSELIKNAYDAEATEVEVKFINSDLEGGDLVITDNGHGMTKDQLINGFMRLSSSDKFHNPISPIFKRLRAGKKGIGRFATQRLGRNMIILTKSRESEKGYRLVVHWDNYKVDQDLGSIKNTIEEVNLDFIHGTQLIITDLRESWGSASIKRVYRYISDLLQPAFLSDRSKTLNVGLKESNNSFNVSFSRVQNGQENIIADVDNMIFDHALGIIEGYVIDGSGICEVVSKRFNIEDTIDILGDFSLLKNVRFKVYYFIYNYKWYEGFIPKMEYSRISSWSIENGGIKLYRNGFRVLPYGEIGNDWLNIDKTSLKTQDNAYVPFNNPNFFGFVEVIDPVGDFFEETSSREGLIENLAFAQLTSFTNKALRQAAQRINSARIASKTDNTPADTSDNSVGITKSTKEKLQQLKGQNAADDATIEEVISELEEIEMLRVLAGIGLSIAEFTHEIRQFIPAFNGSINYLQSEKLSAEGGESLLNLQENFNRFKSYTAYIDHTITQNANRDKFPIDLRTTVRSFHAIILNDLNLEKIVFEEEYYGFDLYTEPMHPSEWTSVLYNLYTNAKKAIRRKGAEDGRIQVICGTENNRVYIEFMDNGDGIPEQNKNRIFDAFFTTSTPASYDANRNEALTGTGLGLKIVKDIISSYQGSIFLVSPEQGFNTSFRIELPEATSENIQKYGY